MKKKPEYRYSEDPNGEGWGCIRLMSGDFSGLTYKYNLVSFEEGEEDCKVNFTYTLVDKPEHYPESDGLKDTMGNILIELLQERYYDYREVDTVESGTERGLPEEGPTIS